MSRRYETANIIEQGIYDLIEVSERHSGALKLADKIIALDKPTGVEAVKKCDWCGYLGEVKQGDVCPKCTGEIVTELTQEECVEVLKQIIICGRYVLVVSDFSRLRVKE